MGTRIGDFRLVLNHSRAYAHTMLCRGHRNNVRPRHSRQEEEEEEEEEVVADVPMREAVIDEAYDDDQIDDLDDALSCGYDPNLEFFETEVKCACVYAAAVAIPMPCAKG